MSNLRKSASYQQPLDKDIGSLIQEANRWTEPIAWTMDSGTAAETAVAHQLDRVPSCVVPVVTGAVTGTGVVSPGTTAWTRTHVYLKATVDGVYAILARR